MPGLVGRAAALTNPEVTVLLRPAEELLVARKLQGRLHFVLLARFAPYDLAALNKVLLLSFHVDDVLPRRLVAAMTLRRRELLPDVHGTKHVFTAACLLSLSVTSNVTLWPNVISLDCVDRDESRAPTWMPPSTTTSPARRLCSSKEARSCPALERQRASLDTPCRLRTPGALPCPRTPRAPGTARPCSAAWGAGC
ncbi:MAG: hypothetical protein ABEI52_03805 [Halobacteriaceae archaeon]